MRSVIAVALLWVAAVVGAESPAGEYFAMFTMGGSVRRGADTEALKNWMQNVVAQTTKSGCRVTGFKISEAEPGKPPHLYATFWITDRTDLNRLVEVYRSCLKIHEQEGFITPSVTLVTFGELPAHAPRR